MYPCSLAHKIALDNSTIIVTLRPKIEIPRHISQLGDVDHRITFQPECLVSKRTKEINLHALLNNVHFAFHCHIKCFTINPEHGNAHYSSNKHMFVLA